MTPPAYADLLCELAELPHDRRSELDELLRQLGGREGPMAAPAPLLLTYRATARNEPALRDTLLGAAGIKVRVPVERIRSNAPRRRCFVLLALADSPVYVAFPPRDAREGSGFISPKFRGLDFIEGLWLTLARPEILSSKALDLIGSIYSVECTPTVYQWDGVRYLSAIAPDSRDEMCRPVFVRSSLAFSPGDLGAGGELRERVAKFVRNNARAPMF